MLIFDLDGTLYQTHKTCLPVLADMCAAHHLVIGPSDEAYLMYTNVAAFLERIAPGMPKADRIFFERDMTARVIDEIGKGGMLYDGVADLLTRFKMSGRVLALCSMAGAAYVNAVLVRCKIASFFDFVCARRDGETKSQMVQALIGTSGASKSACVMIGDSISDLTAARDHAIRFIGVGYGYGKKDIQGHPIAENVWDLGRLIDSL